MAVKQNGVLATFTPPVSKYTNTTVESNAAFVSPNEWCMYTCPQSTLVSAKLFISNNTGGALNVDVGIVEQTDIIQLDVVGNQPGSPSNFTAFNWGSGTSSNFATTIKLEHSAVTNGPFQAGETISWTNPALGSSFQSATAIVQYVDASNNILWLRNMSHPLGLKITAFNSNTAVDATFTGGTSGASASAGPSHAGTQGTTGWSGNLRYYDAYNGQLYLQNREFKNNINYEFLYANDANENRVQNNNNLNRSLGRIWRPVAANQTTYSASSGAQTTVTTIIDSQGNECIVSSVSHAAPEQYIAQDLQVADNSLQEISGIVLGEYQSVYVKSTGAVTFSLVGFEESAETLS